MTVPIGIWYVEIVLALLCTYHCWFGFDDKNYTDAVCGGLSVVLWFVVGLSALTGIWAEDMTYSASWMMLLFIIIGILQGLITFVKILDIVKENKNKKYTNTHFMGLE